MRFTEVARAVGIDFEHANSATSNKYLLETMGGGVALLDYDNDGRVDVFFTNGAKLEDPMPEGKAPDKTDRGFWNRLFRQNADGTFIDVTEKAGLTGMPQNRYGMGVDFADYDNDGRPDIMVTDLSNERYRLFRQGADGSFQDVTSTSGVGAATLLFAGWSARFFDYDNDGWKDLFVAQGHVMDRIEKTSPTCATGSLRCSCATSPGASRGSPPVTSSRASGRGGAPPSATWTTTATSTSWSATSASGPSSSATTAATG